jgi:hypothetical protein
MTVAELVAVLGSNDRTVDEVAASAADPEMALAEQSAAGAAAARDRAPVPRRSRLRVPWRR